MCICSTYCLQFRLEKSGIFLCLESDDHDITITWRGNTGNYVVRTLVAVGRQYVTVWVGGMVVGGRVGSYVSWFNRFYLLSNRTNALCSHQTVVDECWCSGR